MKEWGNCLVKRFDNGPNHIKSIFMLNRLLFVPLIGLLFVFTSHAQDLPKFINLSDGATSITTGNEDITGFYNESKLRQLYLEFNDAYGREFIHRTITN